ncbi:hypothetical protein HDV05_005638 [Chytridiales sp. JEL 0842]|nr:hypothetical protein HDV05_005638 [Chytridiales sp. JEL 0842]
MKYLYNTLALSAALASYVAAQSSSGIESGTLLPTGTLTGGLPSGTMTSGLPTGTMSGPLPSGTGAPGEFPPGTGPGLPPQIIQATYGAPFPARPGGPTELVYPDNFIVIYGADVPAFIQVENTPPSVPAPPGFILYPGTGAYTIQIQTQGPPVEAKLEFKAAPGTLPPGKTMQDLTFAMMTPGGQWMMAPTTIARDDNAEIVHVPQNGNLMGTWVVLVNEMGGMGRGMNGTNSNGQIRTNSSSISTKASWIGAMGAIAVASLFV